MDCEEWAAKIAEYQALLVVADASLAAAQNVRNAVWTNLLYAQWNYQELGCNSSSSSSTSSSSSSSSTPSSSSSSSSSSTTLGPSTSSTTPGPQY